MLILGVLSGTSADGIDVGIFDINGDSDITMKQLFFKTVPFTPEERKLIFALMKGEANVRDVCRANFRVGEAFGRACLHVISESGLKKEDISLIASHGQTIWHDIDYATQKVTSTLQIGESSVIAEMTGITCVADFRVADVAAGGQGAPLTSIFDNLLLRPKTDSWRALQNLGGIGNVTFLPPSSRQDLNPIGFDTGPANVLLDWFMVLITEGKQTYDLNGEYGSQGQVNEPLLQEMMSHPYFKKTPPKTTGRELFNEALAETWFQRSKSLGLSNHDFLATLTDLTALSMVQAYHDFAPSDAQINEILISGGGAHNPLLISRINYYLKNYFKYQISVKNHQELDIESDSKEAYVFALLGYLCIRGKPSSVAACTGGKDGRILGKITPGLNFHQLIGDSDERKE